MSGRPARGGPYYFRLEKSVMANANPTPLMPHATAAWLVDNTGLTFVKIAEYCGIHILEVQAIADETAATKYTGRDPVSAHELSMEEIEKGQNDPNYKPKLNKQAQDTMRSEEHTSEIQSLLSISYEGFCGKKHNN